MHRRFQKFPYADATGGGEDCVHRFNQFLVFQPGLDAFDV
jgi:hypothetical protein